MKIFIKGYKPKGYRVQLHGPHFSILENNQFKYVVVANKDYTLNPIVSAWWHFMERDEVDKPEFDKFEYALRYQEAMEKTHAV